MHFPFDRLHFVTVILLQKCLKQVLWKKDCEVDGFALFSLRCSSIFSCINCDSNYYPFTQWL